LHPPTNSGAIALVDKWLTLPNMGHIVANYYNRFVVLLPNNEIGTSESIFPLRGLPPAKQKIPVMCLGLMISVKKELNRLYILCTLITWFASYPAKSSQILKNHSIMLFTSNANSL